MKRIIVWKAENGWIMEIQHFLNGKLMYFDTWVFHERQDVAGELEAQLDKWGGEGE